MNVDKVVEILEERIETAFFVLYSDDGLAEVGPSTLTEDLRRELDNLSRSLEKLRSYQGKIAHYNYLMMKELHYLDETYGVSDD